MKNQFDVIVIGLGAMGSATLYHLARRGLRVLGLEQFGPGHELGSSHGDSRIIREQYFEHPLYVPLVQRAYELWRELEDASGERLMSITGGLMIGPPGGVVVKGATRSASEHGLASETLSPAEVRSRYPAFDLQEGLVAVVDPRAGFLDADACNAAHIGGAVEAGAVARYGERALRWSADGGAVTVETTAITYTASRLLLSVGAWTGALVGELRLPVTIERQVVFWFDPADGAYAQSGFPIYAFEYTPGEICYGFPRLARGVKASVMHDGALAATPSDVRRNVADDEVRPLRHALGRILPDLAGAPLRSSGVCLFTNTPDRDFIVDWHPEHRNVLISSPCSGHGFKFASALGELQANLLSTGQTTFDISPFRLDRFL